MAMIGKIIIILGQSNMSGWEIAERNGCFNGRIIEGNAEGISSKPFLITGLVGAMLRLFLSHIIPRID